MVNSMNLRRVIDKKINDKRGSYIVEAALTLPVLIICVCALVLTIKIISCCENMCFATAEEMLNIDLEAYKFNNAVSLCKDIEERLKKEDVSDFKITRFRYLYNQGGMTDLVAFEAKAKFKVVNAVGINGEIEFEEKLLTRGFTGTLQGGEALRETDFCKDISSCKVFVFPKYGVRYHRESCKYVRQYGEEACKLKMEKEDAKRKGYTPCKACGGAANV